LAALLAGWVLAAPTFLRTADSSLAAQGGAPSPGQTRPAGGAEGGDVRAVHVQGDVYMLMGAGPNIAVQAGPDGALLVDTGTAASAEKVLAAIRGISTSGRPIQYIINTSYHEDHNGGNEAISKAGKRLVDPGEAAPIVAHEGALKRMTAPTGSVSPRRAAEWPTDTYFEASKELFFNGESIQIFHEPSAVTDGDSIVFFRHSDVIVAGDIFLTTTYPVIDLQGGGSINGIIDGLNHILDLAVPGNHQEDGTLIIPGRGRLCDESDVANYRDMLTIVRDRVQDAIKRGLTLAQVKTAKLTLEYDGRYGATPGAGSTDAFTEAVFKSLSTPTSKKK